MDQSYESLLSLSEHHPTEVSPYLSTQINETICSCCCGCGCSCAGPGEDVEKGHGRTTDSESGTAVGSSDSENEDNLPQSQQTSNNNRDIGHSNHRDAGYSSPRSVMYQGRLWFLPQTEALHSEDSFEDWEAQSENEDGGKSMINEAPMTDSRSNAVSEYGNVRMMSPGPGIGALFGPDVEDIELVYHFDIRPLRLSPEFEHARGLVREHLLVPDEGSFRTTK